MAKIETTIKEFIKNYFELDELPDEINQTTIARWDSLHHIGLITSLETKFGVKINSLVIPTLINLERLVECFGHLEK